MREFALTTAYKFLIENNLASLPVDPVQIALLCGYKVFTYTQFARLINKNIAHLVMQYDRSGFTFWSKRDHCFIICYNPRQTADFVRWTLVHELGHIYMRHVSKGFARARYGTESPLFEAEAQEFTRFVLCPPVVLFNCMVFDSEEIAALCGVPRKESVFISSRMKRYTRTTIPQESTVEVMFAPFVSAYLDNKKGPPHAMHRTAQGGENIKRRPALPTPDGYMGFMCICVYASPPSILPQFTC